VWAVENTGDSRAFMRGDGKPGGQMERERKRVGDRIYSILNERVMG
jgi:hypothetical protein